MINPDKFVRVRGTHFAVGAEPYAFAGVNFWSAAYLGLAGSAGDRPRLLRELDQLQRLGVTNLRILAASEPTPYAPLTPVFQPRPREYNEKLLQGLDFALDQIGRRGMKAVLYLNNQWEWSGGMATYVEWVTGEKRPPAGRWPDTLRFDLRFYVLPQARALHQEYVRMLTARTNTINGRAYRLDPAIMTWQLANEPRAGDATGLGTVAEGLYSWVDETSRLIRSLAPHQLISTGSEGLAGSEDKAAYYERVHALPAIDYLTVHIWPFNWFWYRPAESAVTLPDSIRRTREYLEPHVAVARTLGKPLVLEEFGLPRDEGRYSPGTPTVARDTYFQTIFDLFRAGRESGSPLAGLNLWSWSGEGVPVDPNGANWQPGQSFTGDNGVEPQGLNSLYSTDRSTLDLLQKLNRELAHPAPVTTP